MRPLPTLRQLRYLVTVAETLHFGQAAEQCFVTQSTLSAGIQELESLLGITLIERQSRRKVVMTPLGISLVERARAILADAEALVDAAHAGAEPLVGELRLGVIPTIGPYVLPRILPEVRQSYPSLKLFLREEQTARVLDDLNRGRIDCGLIALPFETGDLAIRELWREDVVAVIPANHRLAAKDSLSDDDISSVDLLMLEDGHCLRDHALQACGLRKPKENEVFQATSVGTLVQMVGSNLGITLIPRTAIPVEIGSDKTIVVRDLKQAQPARSLALVWRPSNPRSADFQLLGDLLIRHAPKDALAIDP
jgi:LysR family hydrogen peroxide-inducible transcriptional activator